MSYSQSVLAQISLNTVQQTQQGFGTPVFIAAHSLYADRIRAYGSLSAMIDDGFLTTDNSYIAANHAFNQSPSVPSVKIGRREQDWTAFISEAGVSSAEVFSFNIDLPSISYSTVVSYSTVGAAETQETILAGLKAAFDADPTLVANLDAVATPAASSSSLKISTKTGEEFFQISAEAGEYTSSYSATESPAVTLTQMDEEDSDYYFIVAEDKSDSYIKLMAAAVELRAAEYFVSKYDAIDLGAYVEGSAVNGVFNELKDLGYDGTCTLSHQFADQYIEMAYIGSNAPYDAGSVTWCNIQAVGAGTSLNPSTGKPLSETHKGNLTSKNVNYVELDNATPYFRTGTMASGEWIDVIRGVDWMKSDITASLKSLLLGQKGTKVPYTEVGAGMVREAVMTSLQRAVNRGFINPDFTVFVPSINALDPSQRVSRILEGVTFEATLQGAIHQVFVQGTVSA